MERKQDLWELNLDEIREHVAELLRSNRRLAHENTMLKRRLEELEKQRTSFLKLGLLIVPLALLVVGVLRFVNL